MIGLLSSLALNRPTARALDIKTEGDGFIPIIYNNKIYNTFHHQSPNGNPSQPTYDINCTDPVTQQACPTYPRYFSSTAGTSGRVGIDTPGPADIYTGTYPQSVIIGSRLFYAANRASDNGIGCFDLSAIQNCGYFQLGTLPKFSGGFGFNGQTDGVEQVGNKLYTLGVDTRVYCLDVSNPGSPTACAGQPYALNTGISSQLPPQNGNPGNVRLVIGNRIYTDINYFYNTPAANAKVTCFDTLTNARCAGWGALTVTPTSGNSISTALFAFPNQQGNDYAVCAAQDTASPVNCWSLTDASAVSPPPGLFAGISRPSPVRPFSVLRLNTRSYFAIHELFQPSDGLALCYDWQSQARCSGFGQNGVKLWDGSDGGVAINNGQTRDYGYASLGNSCLIGLGDSGVMWSFDAQTGFTIGSLINCSPSVTTPVVPTQLPNTGLPAKAVVPLIIGGIAMFTTISVLAYRRYRHQPHPVKKPKKETR